MAEEISKIDFDISAIELGDKETIERFQEDTIAKIIAALASTNDNPEVQKAALDTYLKILFILEKQSSNIQRIGDDNETYLEEMNLEGMGIQISGKTVNLDSVGEKHFPNQGSIIQSLFDSVMNFQIPEGSEYEMSSRRGYVWKKQLAAFFRFYGYRVELTETHTKEEFQAFFQSERGKKQMIDSGIVFHADGSISLDIAYLNPPLVAKVGNYPVSYLLREMRTDFGLNTKIDHSDTFGRQELMRDFFVFLGYNVSPLTKIPPEDSITLGEYHSLLTSGSYHVQLESCGITFDEEKGVYIDTNTLTTLDTKDQYLLNESFNRVMTQLVLKMQKQGIDISNIYTVLGDTNIQFFSAIDPKCFVQVWKLFFEYFGYQVKTLNSMEISDTIK